MKFLKNCPICNGEKFLAFAGYDYKPGPEIYEFLGLDRNTSVWSICKKCGFIFQNPRAHMKKIKELYSSGIYREDREYKDYFFEQKYERPLTHLKWGIKHGMQLEKDASILDIGAGFGAGVKAFIDKGYKACGIELDNNLCNEANKRYGVKLINSDIDKVELKESSFDLIYSSHVHEHFDDFNNVNEKLYKLLKPGGYMLCILPTYKLSAKNGQGGINVFHNSIFTKKSLYNMMIKCDLVPLAFKYPFSHSLPEVWGIGRKEIDKEGQKKNYKKENAYWISKEIKYGPILFEAIYPIFHSIARIVKKIIK